MENSLFLWGLLLIPAAYGLYGFHLRWRKKIITAMGEPQMVNKLLRGYAAGRRLTKLHFLLAAITFLCVALANPQLAPPQPLTERVGAKVIFVLDVSLSMLAEDSAPNRLEKAKFIITRAVNALPEGQIAVVVFSGVAQPLVPFTADYLSVQNALHAVNTNLLPVPGSSFAAAIKMAIRLTAKKEDNSPYVFLLSDGEDHAAVPDAALDSAARKGLKIFTMGLGTRRGSTIPVRQADGRILLKKDPGGKTVYTALQDSVLKKIAATTGGQYRLITHTQEGVDFITAALPAMPSPPSTAQAAPGRESLFPWFLGAALVCLLLEFMYSKRKEKSYRSA